MTGTSSTNNTQPKEQEVWLANFPFDDDPNTRKLRPVIVLSKTDDGMTVAGLKEDSYLSVKVTGHTVRPEDDYDTIIVKWREANLNRESVARVSKTMELPESEFVRKLGEADDTDFTNIFTRYVEFLESAEAPNSEAEVEATDTIVQSEEEATVDLTQKDE